MDQMRQQMAELLARGTSQQPPPREWDTSDYTGEGYRKVTPPPLPLPILKLQRG